jgi:hypothetical protein
VGGSTKNRLKFEAIAAYRVMKYLVPSKAAFRKSEEPSAMSPVLEPICRGLVGYVSYLGACRNSTIYSEYLLYEPFLRIAHAQGYRTDCEVPVAASTSGKGDKKRIDFVVTFARVDLRFGFHRAFLQVISRQTAFSNSRQADHLDAIGEQRRSLIE